MEVALHADEDGRRPARARLRDGVDGTRPAGIGLLTMRERADELGGAVTVDSAPALGTTVTARLPLRESAAVVLT